MEDGALRFPCDAAKRQKDDQWRYRGDEAGSTPTLDGGIARNGQDGL
jgi:hypothetical protein